MLARPKKNEYPDYYEYYISLSTDENIIEQMREQTNSIAELIKSLSEEKVLYKYAEGKWTIKELIGHLIDAEKVIACRALRIARNDSNDIPQYDHDDYVTQSDYNNVDLNLLLNMFKSTRESNQFLFDSFNDDEWMRSGTSDGKTFTVRTMPYILYGHMQHHLNVLQEKYL